MNKENKSKAFNFSYSSRRIRINNDDTDKMAYNFCPTLNFQFKSSVACVA